MSDNEKRNQTKAPAEGESHPATNTKPRGNQDVDQRRVDLGREDQDRTGAN